nr:MAG TPA: hypothetical protein [Crassvirales sp.]
MGLKALVTLNVFTIPPQTVLSPKATFVQFAV